MRADAAKELVTLSYINYECELRYEWLEVDLGGTRNQHGDLEDGPPRTLNKLTNSFLGPFTVTATFKQFIMVLTVVVGSSGSGMCLCSAS